MKKLTLLALLALVLPVHADFYWLAVGITSGANGQVNGGAGNYLVLANDDPSVSFDAVKLFDVRRRANNGTELYKNNGQNSTPPYEGCPFGGAHYDLRLPIRDAAGNEVFTERQVHTGNGYARLDWTAHTYDAQNRRLRSVKSNGKPVVLTDTEYAILEYLLQKRGSIVTAAELYEAVWGAKFLAGSGNTVMVHVLNVRRKIEEDPSKPKILRTVWGRGYQID